MSRDQDRVALNVNNGAASGGATTTNYFVLSDDRPAIFKRACVLGINPASTNGDTLRSVWDYSTDGGANYTTLADNGVDEYNDTDDVNSFGVHGSTAATVDISTAAQKNVRVAAGAIIRHREIWAGTVGDGHAVHQAEFVVI